MPQITDIEQAKGTITAIRAVEGHIIVNFDDGRYAHFTRLDGGVALSTGSLPLELEPFTKPHFGNPTRFQAQCVLVNKVLALRILPPMDKPLTAYGITYPSPYMICYDEVTALHELVRQLPPNPLIVNIGAWRGTSTIAMLEERPDAFIFSIDIEPMPFERENLELAQLWDLHRVVRVLGRSQEVVKYWPWKPKLDMVFIDGDHSREGCRGDFAWIPFVRSGGVIAVHDYHQWHTPEVTLAVDELLVPKYQQLAHVEFLIAFRQP